MRTRYFASPSVILLTFDWPQGKDRNDFLGFAIKRRPGFWNHNVSWLPNRIGFSGASENKRDLPSNLSPIQKFMWWDSRIDEEDVGKKITYTVYPVVGSKDSPQLYSEASSSVSITVPSHAQNGIGTWFNRPVVSSQAFSRKFRTITDSNRHKALSWLADGMEKVIPSFISDCKPIEGAIYHLSDKEWIIPAFENHSDLSLVYDHDPKDNSNDYALSKLGPISNINLTPRKNAAIMHNKFLVKMNLGKPSSVLMGSANFTTQAMTIQANLLHTFDSPELSNLYFQRKKLLESDPTRAETRKHAGWSDKISIGSAKVRVFFSPEPTKSRESIDQIISSLDGAKSVLFCLFSPTDEKLRNALFKIGDSKNVMFGLVNKISKPKTSNSSNAAELAKIELYHRSKKNKDVFSYAKFEKTGHPLGFWWETSTIPGMTNKHQVNIHHKFIVINGQTDNPIIYTGSANLSKNSLHNNDESLLEITGSPGLGRTYVAEFFRLYEHYRARSVSGKRGAKFKLMDTSEWSKKYYSRGTPEFKSRISMT